MGGGGSGGSGGPAANGSISGSKRRRVSDGMELEANGAAAGEGGGYFGLKYLTSSRLLRLQLRDPTLRLQVCRLPVPVSLLLVTPTACTPSDVCYDRLYIKLSSKLAKLELLIWERVRATLFSVAKLPKFSCSCRPPFVRVQFIGYTWYLVGP